MKTSSATPSKSLFPVRIALLLLMLFTSLISGLATVLDNFNAAQSSGWTDANPIGLPLPGGQQANGTFTFDLSALGQPYFISSTKTTTTFELKEGRTIEFRVDMISGRGPDSYAVLAFIPTSTGANSLAGYGMAKSESDVLVTKGINKYFIDDSPSVPVKNTNVTLVLNLAVRSGNVNITAQVLDKDANNQVIWTRTFVDTPGADVLGKGTDSPPAPYITSGNFVLYLYADNGNDPVGYQVVFDNAEYFVTDSNVLDDFNAAQRSGWEDSNPIGLPLPGGVQGNGLFTFDLSALGQAYFIDSTKTTKTFSLDEGTRHEFAVDMISGKGPDSYAVLAFVPTANGANSLAGYGFAKSETDILVTKGINKYFIDDNPSTPVKNSNITLMLTLTAQNGNLTIQGRILDKDNNNQVLWEKTFVDTPGADVLGKGTDSPPAPYIGMSGNVVLYLYADNGADPTGYQVVLDNLTVGEPPSAGNLAPIIANVTPRDGAAFQPAPASVSFTATDDKPLPDSGISVILNNTVYTSTNGLALSGDTTNRTVTLGVGTGPNTNYVAVLILTDADGLSVTNSLYFDTFITSSNRVVEIEDYNYSNGQYINYPVPAVEFGGQSFGSYIDQVGTEGVDFHDTQTAPHGTDTTYRTQDPVRMQHSIDQTRPQYDSLNGIFGYDVGDIATDEWLNYTKDFAPGNYVVYLREAVVGLAQGNSALELVTSDASQTNQTVSPLGSFLGKQSGYTFHNVPLTDGSGLNTIVLRLSGKTTLRLHQITADTSSAARYQNYLIFVPAGASSVQRPIITSLQPADGSTVQSVSPVITVNIQNRDTSLDTNTVVLNVNGQPVIPKLAVTSSGATVTWNMTPLPASGVLNSASIAFKDTQGTNQSTAWSFTVTYFTLNAVNAAAAPGPDRGMHVRVVQAPQGTTLDNSLDRAEQQLVPNSSIPIAVDTNVVLQIMSMTKNGAPFGNFQDYTDLPGIDGNIGYDGFVVEAETWLLLSAGIYQFGANTDDGYKISAGATPAAQTPILAFHNSGPGNETTDFVVPANGVYPFRFLWYQQGGNAYGQWFSVNRTTGEQFLINDPNSTNAVQAFLTASNPQAPLFSAPSLKNGQLTITWTGGGTLQESTDARTWTAVPGNPAGSYTVPVASGAKFYRVKQ